MPHHPLHEPVLAWYEASGRDLPWREPSCPPWGVLVSEFMLQQTPVARVEPVWREWLRRWPTPLALAVDSPGEAIRAWGRLGYPRRALRLHEAAALIVRDHGGDVPVDQAALLALPGVGAYTAAAVASFAFGRRHAVLDTNVRRVLARAVTGTPAAPVSATKAERLLAESLLPDDETAAAMWAAATMELGALVCTARSPACGVCPVRRSCRWQLLGTPPDPRTRRRTQPYAGTDREVRGLLLAALRSHRGPLPWTALAASAPDHVLRDPAQRDRCLHSLLADGLVHQLPADRFTLPE